jgi:hypothetical protein
MKERPTTDLLSLRLQNLAINFIKHLHPLDNPSVKDLSVARWTFDSYGSTTSLPSSTSTDKISNCISNSSIVGKFPFNGSGKESLS